MPTAPRERVTPSVRHAFANSFDAYYAPLSWISRIRLACRAFSRAHARRAGAAFSHR
ncbi:hypothetical protein [Streptomyces sp. T028]|uniref:hypothetical protein n=1 Tax=Streptomyces sp. T028 TaxID=3394379 RepID=UPI003A8B0488